MDYKFISQENSVKHRKETFLRRSSQIPDLAHSKFSYIPGLPSSSQKMNPFCDPFHRTAIEALTSRI
jgi:hypothetical protein